MSAMVGSNLPARDVARADVDLEGVLGCLLDVCVMYGFDATGYSLAKTKTHWRAMCDAVESLGDAWMKVAKYKISAFFAFHQAPVSGLPARPWRHGHAAADADDPGVLLGGRVHRWMRMLRSSRDRQTESRWQSLCFSLLMSKKGMPRPGPGIVADGVLTTTKQLTSWNPTGKRTVSCLLRDGPDASVEVIDWADSAEQPRLVREFLDMNPDSHPVRVQAEHVEAQCRRTVREIFANARDRGVSMRVDWTKPRFPSTSANYINSRKLGGAVSMVESVIRELYPPDEDKENEYIRPRLTFGKFRVHPQHQEIRDVINDPYLGFLPPERRLAYARLLDASQRFEDERIEGGDQGWDSRATQRATSERLEIDADRFRQNWAAVSERIRQHATGKMLSGRADVLPVGLSEALKVRVITKGEPETQTYLKAVQERLRDVLHGSRVFALAGGDPISVGYLTERLGARGPMQTYVSERLWPDAAEDAVLADAMAPQGRSDGRWLVSGDWKSSTDYLDPKVSEWITDEIARELRLDVVERLMLRRNLIGNQFKGDIQLPEGFEPTAEQRAYWSGQGVVFVAVGNRRTKRLVMRIVHALPQRWGQLMGSICSFPVLCIAAAALTRWAMEYGDGRLWTLRDAPLAVNGDDTVFKTGWWGWLMYQKLGDIFGLVTSVGKTYVSRTYCNMNSRSFVYRPEAHMVDVVDRDDWKSVYPRESHLTEIPFINMGLVRGTGRSTAVVGVLTTKRDNQSLGSRANELLALAPSYTRQLVWKKFLNSHWDELSKVKVPWYMPEWIGGLGLPWLHTADYLAEVEREGPRRPMLSDLAYGPTEEDLRRARFILLNWSRRAPRRVVATPSWNVHKMVNSILPCLPVQVSEERELPDDNYQELYAMLCCETLFRDAALHKDGTGLLDESVADVSLRTLRHNEDIWSKAKPCGGELMSLAALVPRVSRDYLRVEIL